MLFKILKGPSSRISTDITPFHEGYAYVTEDGGDFYVDLMVEGKQKRVQINPDEIPAGGKDGQLLTKTATGWEWKDAPADGDMHASTYDPQGKRTDVFKYVDDAIGKIPTPDVSAQIKAHNESTTAHPDIRAKIPTNTSQLTNDSGFLTQHQDISGKLDKTGDGSNVTAAFTAATTRANIATGEKLSVLFGKIAKWFADLGALAFKSTVAKSDLARDVQTSLGKADSALQSYTETDPTVPEWAKAESKPSYTKSEVGLANVDNVKQYSASNPPPYPVTSVNGKTGAVTVSVPAVPSTAAILKGNGSGSMVAAVAGTDYAAASHTHTQADVTGLEDWDKTVLLKSSSVKTTLPTNTKWTSVCYGNGKFVAITSTSIAAYSTDGINWTQTTLPAYASWCSVCYGGGKFVAVASRKNIAAYSTDGINWVQTTIPILNCQSVCYGDGKFVVVAQSTTVAAYSTDGINWTQTTIGTRFAWTSVCYGDGKFVAIAQDNSGAAYSTDGINWTQTTMPVDQSWKSVCYGNGKFMAVAYGFTNIVAYSTDGINWMQTTMGGSVAAWISVCYGNGKFVAIAQNGTNYAYSTDGINWAQTAMPVMANWYANCYGDGKFVAIVYSSNIAACSFIATTNPAGTNVADDLKTVLGINGLKSFGLLKGDGSGGIVAATRGSDYIASGNIVKQTLVSAETDPTENYAINWLYG